jgi:hypothetical protein
MRSSASSFHFYRVRQARRCSLSSGDLLQFITQYGDYTAVLECLFISSNYLQLQDECSVRIAFSRPGNSGMKFFNGRNLAGPLKMATALY